MTRKVCTVQPLPQNKDIALGSVPCHLNDERHPAADIAMEYSTPKKTRVRQQTEAYSSYPLSPLCSVYNHQTPKSRTRSKSRVMSPKPIHPLSPAVKTKRQLGSKHRAGPLSCLGIGEEKWRGALKRRLTKLFNNKVQPVLTLGQYQI